MLVAHLLNTEAYLCDISSEYMNKSNKRFNIFKKSNKLSNFHVKK